MRLRALAVFALAVFTIGPLIPHLAGQSVISARAGLINYSEGLVFRDGQPVARKVGAYQRLGNGSTLMTQSGRAEVLLTPNTYLRIGENSSIRMVSDSLAEPSVEMLAGSASLDSEGASQSSVVKLTFSDATIRFLKPGRYRIDADPPQLRVFEGEAEVKRNGVVTNVESSQLMPLHGASVVTRFTEGADGLLDIWADERHELIASNLLNSQSISDPLVDNGPDYASLGAYGGYIPLVSVPVIDSAYYGYNPYGYNSYGSGFYAYNPTYLIVRPNYSRVLTIYGLRTGSTPIFGPRPGSGTVNVPHPVVFAPRPTAPAPVHVGVRVGGHR
jgi:FecR protein